MLTKIAITSLVLRYIFALRLGRELDIALLVVLIKCRTHILAHQVFMVLQNNHLKT